MNTPVIPLILQLLENEYGHREFIPHRDPLGELVQTILSQNTSDLNSRPAYSALKAAFKSWDNILTADTSRVAEIIRRAD